ncbi:hypothetical protein RIF23_20720, partial [Lipingzhangella sp. LS1_29]|nr:hypothetical protein [Lipingzhangella rawalii]
MYFKTNVSEELIAELIFVDQATISRAISELEEPIADVLHEFVPDPADEVDGRGWRGRWVSVSFLVMVGCTRALLRQAQDHGPQPPVRLRFVR